MRFYNTLNPCVEFFVMSVMSIMGRDHDFFDISMMSAISLKPNDATGCL
jgi:hypothetical protein